MSSEKLTEEDDKKKDDDKSSIACKLTDEEKYHVQSFDISPDGEKIAFMATPSSNMEDY